MADPATDSRPTSQVVSDIVDDTRTLFRQELELAKLEITAAVSAKLQAVAALAVAGVVALLFVVFGAVSGAEALSNVIPRWAAYLTVAGAFLLVGILAGLFAVGRAKLPVEPVETKRTLKENAEWARGQLTS